MKFDKNKMKNIGAECLRLDEVYARVHEYDVIL